jgi:hypothetical protein
MVGCYLDLLILCGVELFGVLLSQSRFYGRVGSRCKFCFLRLSDLLHDGVVDKGFFAERVIIITVLVEVGASFTGKREEQTDGMVVGAVEAIPPPPCLRYIGRLASGCR